MLTKQVPYTIMKQLSFDYTTRFLYAHLSSFPIIVGYSKWEISILSAFFASIMACIASQPGDVLLTETYKGDGGSDENENGLLGLVRNTYESNGIPAFFIGLKPRLLHVACIITSQLVLYDIIKQLLGLPATGSS